MLNHDFTYFKRLVQRCELLKCQRKDNNKNHDDVDFERCKIILSAVRKSLKDLTTTNLDSFYMM